MAATNKEEQTEILSNNNANEQDEVFKQFNLRNIMLPVIFTLVVVIYLLFRDLNPADLKNISLTSNAAFWFFMCLVAMVARHLFFMWRIKILTDNEFSWKQCFQVITIWEFASTATPSAVGGTAVALPLISKEGINIGRTTTIVLTTMVLDGLFFLLVIGSLWFFVGSKLLDNSAILAAGKMSNYPYAFIFGYTITVGYTLLFAYGLFINPKPIRWLFEKIFSLPFVRRWQEVGQKAGQDLVIASVELRKKSKLYWINSYIATVGAWSCRLLVVNFVLLTINNNFDQILVFTKSAVIFITMAIIPTPGSSGAAELSFINVLYDFMPTTIGTALALVWRIFTYFIFLPLGFVVLPIWLRRVLKKGKRIK